jgi:hypothetical protein
VIERIEHHGVLISDCTIAGEGRSAGAVPAHPNGIQVSRDRWLLLYATRRFRGVDDDCSVVYQLRRDGPVGPVLKEGLLARSVDDWDALGDGRISVRQHGHPVAFGVPRGAWIGGRPAPHANLFVAKWRRVARLYDRQRNLVVHQKEVPDLRRATQAVEWVQFRLNDAEDDVEILDPVRVLRQKGYEAGPAFCSAPGVGAMNQSFTQAMPFNADATEWVDANHFDQRRVAALKYRYNPGAHRYEWVETGPFMNGPEEVLTEASLVRAGDKWIIGARTERGVGAAWVATADPFDAMPPITYAAEPICTGPFTAYTCPDGVLRSFGGDARNSPYGRSRDPLYCWDVDPRTFRASNRRVVFDTVAAGLPFRAEATPIADMCKLLPHQGRTQYAVHRVRVRAIDHPYVPVLLDDAERANSAIYHAALTYDREYPGPWSFENLTPASPGLGSPSPRSGEGGR